MMEKDSLGKSEIRRPVDKDLRRRKLDWNRVSALTLALLDSSKNRVGNPEYRRRNRSYGLTTLRDRHVEITEMTIRIVARALGNTPVTCRKYYIHPAIIEAYEENRLTAAFEWGKKRKTRSDDESAYFRPAERAVLKLLRSERAVLPGG